MYPPSCSTVLWNLWTRVTVSLVTQDVLRACWAHPCCRSPGYRRSPSFLHLLNLSHIIRYPLWSQIPKTVPILFLFILAMFFCPAHIHTHKLVPAVVNYSTENAFFFKKSEWRISTQSRQWGSKCFSLVTRSFTCWPACLRSLASSLPLVDLGWTGTLAGQFLRSFTFCEEKLVALFCLKIALHEFSSCLERTFWSLFWPESWVSSATFIAATMPLLKAITKASHQVSEGRQ